MFSSAIAYILCAVIPIYLIILYIVYMNAFYSNQITHLKNIVNAIINVISMLYLKYYIKSCYNDYYNNIKFIQLISI